MNKKNFKFFIGSIILFSYILWGNYSVTSERLISIKLKEENKKLQKIITEYEKKDKLLKYIDKKIPSKIKSSKRILIRRAIYDCITEYPIKNKPKDNIDLIISFIQTESSFRIDAHSIKNAIGLMQVTSIAHEEVLKKWKDIPRPIGGLLDPYYNIVIGYRYLYYLRKIYLNQDKFKNMSEAEKDIRFILMYNFGPYHKEIQRSSLDDIIHFKYYKKITKYRNRS